MVIININFFSTCYSFNGLTTLLLDVILLNYRISSGHADNGDNSIQFEHLAETSLELRFRSPMVDWQIRLVSGEWGAVLPLHFPEFMNSWGRSGNSIHSPPNLIVRKHPLPGNRIVICISEFSVGNFAGAESRAHVGVGKGWVQQPCYLLLI